MREAELMARDRWSREDLLTFQRERLRALVTHAVTNSPYYREVLGADAAERPLTDLPTLPKATMMAEFDHVVTDPRLRLDDLRAHLAGPDPSKSFLGEYRVATTSGTTGRRSIVAFTHDEAAAWRAASARPMMRIGVGPGPRFAALGSPSPVHVTRQVLVPPGVPTPPISAATPISELVAALNAQQPEVLVGAVGVWRALAEEQIAGRLRIEPRAAFFSSEAVTADVRRRVREAWGIELVSGYAATEAPTIAASSPEHPEMEIAEDVVVLEIVDEEARPGSARAARRQGAAHELDQPRSTADSLRVNRLRCRVTATQPHGPTLALPAFGRRTYRGHSASPRTGRRDGANPPFRARVGSGAHC
jgi:phenylacetate-CoA ligase